MPKVLFLISQKNEILNIQFQPIFYKFLQNLGINAIHTHSQQYHLNKMNLLFLKKNSTNNKMRICNHFMQIIKSCNFST